MSDHNDHNVGMSGPGRKVRLAYTLNNEQPVRCTLVSEEPLFYLDAPVTDDDEMMDLGLPLDLLFDQPDLEPAMLPLVQNAAHDAIELFKAQFGAHVDRATTLEETFTVLRQSRLATSLLDFATENKVQIKEATQIPAIAYDRMNSVITLRTGLGSAEQVLLLTRELRRVWQHRQGALIHPLLFHPDHAIVINRVQAADLMTFMVRTSWELRLAGQSLAWDFLETSGYDDLTRAFAREALNDFRSLNSGRAAAAAFESWFLSERCRSFDRTLIQQMLADYQSYVHKAGHEDTSRVLTHQLIAALGAMPYGNNYLAMYAATILADPIFTEIRDRSNANFLWFIKFEQSFRQTERDLQTKEGSASNPSSVGTVHATSATILAYPAGRSVDRTQDRASRAGGQARPATIVDLQGWQQRRPHAD